MLALSLSLSLSLCLCGNVCVYTCVAFSKNQPGAQISFASITTIPNAVILPFTIVRVGRLLFSLLLLEYPCSWRPLMFAALETRATAMMMYCSARQSGERRQQGYLGQRRQVTVRDVGEEKQGAKGLKYETLEISKWPSAQKDDGPELNNFPWMCMERYEAA